MWWLTPTLSLLVLPRVWSHSNVESDPCDVLNTLSLENTTIIDASYIHATSNITTPGSCQSSAIVPVNVCRVYGVVNTSPESAVKFEIWLPSEWHGRFLGVGNGGLGGCIDYLNIGYGTSLHFATIGSDNGHDGNTGVPFLNHPEVVEDYAHRAVHVEAILGKQIVEAYYKRTPAKSYFLGCSTGGRQGLQSALRYPDDFDGIVAGSPSADFNHIMGWRGHLGTYIGAPNPQSGSSFISQALWAVISQEILYQCDAADGLFDGIISEPDECNFIPEVLLCSEHRPKDCLTRAQVDALGKIYSPLNGSHEQLLYPRYDPGAEGAPSSWDYFDGEFFKYTRDWMRYAIYEDSTLSFSNFSVEDIEYADKVNPGNIRTWSTDFTKFRERGGKLLTFHGRRDPMIASGNSKRLHGFIASEQQEIDEFYRLFLIPGMNHCAGGPGAWAIGQGGYSGETQSNPVNDTAHNVLLAMVDWVENGVAPSSVTGVDYNKNERVHCMYPQRSVWTGSNWTCV